MAKIPWNGFTIREGNLEDLDTILTHRRNMFVDIGYRDDLVLDVVDSNARPFFRERIADGRYRAWLVETQGGEVVAGGGIMIFDHVASPRDPHTQRAHIVNVYTEPTYRRRGFARKLMEIMVQWCKDQGFGSVTLYASKDGRPLYETMGFKPTNEMRLMLREGAEAR
ncbi:MAG TPA: GNAT family N-acetyltransferase [Bacteroidota bacterium]|nr:GNAT family N-acetyltransferase [Bacteroidota bacterium]